MVLATEVRNNNCKVAKWALQAILAGSDYIKFGYDIKFLMRNFPFQLRKPRECAQQCAARHPGRAPVRAEELCDQSAHTEPGQLLGHFARNH